MRLYFLIIFSISVLFTTCTQEQTSQSNNHPMPTNDHQLHYQSGYAQINGLRMYYEIYGKGEPLVLIHGGGSTIQSNFEKVIPLFAQNRQVVAVELQAHGRTSDRGIPSSFEQDADDVASLLETLNIPQADFLGFSNGGTTVLQIAIRHPKIVKKIMVCSALAKRNGVFEGFWEFMKQAKLENMPEPLQKAYLKVNPDTNGLKIMHDRDAYRMINFKDIPDESLRGIKAPTLIIMGDRDVPSPEHGLVLHRLIPNSRLAILPSAHGDYLGEITTLKPDFQESDLAVPIIERFLNTQ